MSDLQRFLDAQQNSYTTALHEMSQGRKRSHWMWYIFPQIRGLGHSYIAKIYEIQSIEEAKSYLAHPILGSRLLEISNAALALDSNDPMEVFGYPDNLKLCSCMTLFEKVVNDDKSLKSNPRYAVFGQILDKYYRGKRDTRTLLIWVKLEIAFCNK